MEFVLKGIKVRVSFLFFAAVSFLMCFNANNEIRLGVLFSLLHETGHLSAFLITRNKPEKICFSAFGMTIVRGSDIRSDYLNDFFTAFAGPLVNILCAVLFLILYFVFKGKTMLECVLVNVLIAAFNLMPVFTLDGGRMLEAFINAKCGFPAEKVIMPVSVVTVAVMFFIGAFVLIRTGYNFSLLLVSAYLCVLIFKKC